jgi:hypothetical protein
LISNLNPEPVPGMRCLDAGKAKVERGKWAMEREGGDLL